MDAPLLQFSFCVAPVVYVVSVLTATSNVQLVRTAGDVVLAGAEKWALMLAAFVEPHHPGGKRCAAVPT